MATARLSTARRWFPVRRRTIRARFSPDPHGHPQAGIGCSAHRTRHSSRHWFRRRYHPARLRPRPRFCYPPLRQLRLRLFPVPVELPCAGRLLSCLSARRARIPAARQHDYSGVRRAATTSPPEPVRAEIENYKWNETTPAPGEQPATFTIALKDGTQRSATAAWVGQGAALGQMRTTRVRRLSSSISRSSIFVYFRFL